MTPNNADETVYTVTRTGDCVSMDQLESSTPGLVAQLKGRPMIKRYPAATVFVDHFSGLSYVHLQKSTSADEMIEARDCFERYAASKGVRILHYHADNGRFTENKFRQAVADRRQTLSVCGANAYFQNAIAERRIGELHDHARTMLIHARKRWPSAIDTHLWSYALHMANDALHSTPNIKRKQIPIEIFSGSKVSFNPMDCYHFGTPVYVLDNDMQAEKIDKWAERARVGINLGRSSQHARTVALVLSMTTGLTSPQFHVKFDPTFQTLRKSFGGRSPPSGWQAKCGSTLEKGKSKVPSEGAATAASDQEYTQLPYIYIILKPINTCFYRYTLVFTDISM
jgi:hypothetical protein